MSDAQSVMPTADLMRAMTEQVMNTVAKAGEKSADKYANAEVKIRREGTQIILPNDPFPMKEEEAIKALERKIKADSVKMAVNEFVEAHPYDGAYAFMKAMKERYGWATPQPTETFFGPKPPNTISLEIEHGVYTQIIWGQFQVPGITGYLETGFTTKDGRPIFCIRGEVLKRNAHEVELLARLTRKFAQEESIYKGKAIALKVDEDGEVDFRSPPNFLDLTRVNPEELTFSAETAEQVTTNLFTPIEYTSACRMHSIPLKRGVLLEGPFGTGKTLTAFVTATKARANGWTFILVDKVGGLKQALQFARMYQPSVVFAEDIDRAVSGDERTIAIDDVLNTIDGIESKGSEVITILTSNDVKGINRAMLRPGRLDAIISVQAPDAKAAERLLRLYARGLIADDADLTEAGVELEGQIPAVIREVVERSKLYAISKSKNGRITITSSELVAAAKGMKNHLALLNPRVEVVASAQEKMGNAFADLVEHSVKRNGVWEAIQDTQKTAEAIKVRLGT